MDGSIIRKSLKKMLEVLVAQYPLSDVWALPGVRAGGNQLAQKGLGRWGLPRPMAGCPAEKAGAQIGVTALPRPSLQQSVPAPGSAAKEQWQGYMAPPTPCLLLLLLLSSCTSFVIAISHHHSVLRRRGAGAELGKLGGVWGRAEEFWQEQEGGTIAACSPPPEPAASSAVVATA